MAGRRADGTWAEGKREIGEGEWIGGGGEGIRPPPLTATGLGEKGCGRGRESLWWAGEE